MPKRSPPSEFFVQQLDRIRAASRLGAVVDLACGRGRHTLAAAEAGIPIVGIDRNRNLLAELHAAAQPTLTFETILADLENPSEIPLRSGCCGAVLVFRYLHRPLIPAIQRVLAPGGLLVYETFTNDQRALESGPRNPDHLLESNELPELFSELEILDHWEGLTSGDEPAQVARISARAGRLSGVATHH
ncbi:MAG: class I SAM-dependent methyltransferase [Deltaproteobacteria bacterium]|jgi:SAM-dependent methyltransferase|nr:class I SAM-dependent methyltransferase [Deltaproteobacteria bacterium]